ncbi:MAG: protease complex subunit PrcB family protein [Bacteroidetes bacterium]|nr:protease complex subunit PrcB family protein [Bacteroidota bacterium]
MIRFVVACIFLFSSCSPGINKKSRSISQDVIAFETIAQDEFGGMTDSKFIVIKDEATFIEVYRLIGKDRLPKVEMPTIDFEKETVIALFLGEKTSGGYFITVKQIVVISDKVNVAYKVTSPKPGDMVTTVMTQPYCIIKMPKTSKEVVFSKLK